MPRMIETAIARGGAVCFPLLKKVCHDFMRLVDDTGCAVRLLLSEWQAIADRHDTYKEGLEHRKKLLREYNLR